jgi:hypothetical protein
MAFHIPCRPLEKTLRFGLDIHCRQQKPSHQQESRLAYQLEVQAQSILGAQLLWVRKQWLSSPANPVEAVVQRLGEPLQELALVINAAGQPLRLHNHAAIWSRWQRVRQQVLSTYSGAWVEALVEKTERRLLSSQAVLDCALWQDWVLSQYFAGVYGQAFSGPDARVERQSRLWHLLSIPVLLNESWQYEATSRGCTIGMVGNWQGEVPGRQLPKAARQGKAGDSVQAVRISKDCRYQMGKDIGWCSGFESRLSLQAGDYHRQVKLKLMMNE